MAVRHTLMLCLVLIGISTTGLVAATAQPSEQATDLGSVVLDVEQLRDQVDAPYTLVDSSATDLKDFESHWLTADRILTKAIQSWEASFLSRNQRFRVHIRMFELVNHYWAAGLQASGNQDATPDFPAGAHLEYRKNKRGMPWLVSNITKGRLLLIVDAAPLPGHEPDGDMETLRPLVRAALAQQLDRLPLTADLDDSRTIDITDVRITLGVLVVSLIPVLSIGYAAAAWARDPSTPERLRSHRPWSPMARDSQILDISSAARVVRHRALGRSVTSVTALTLVAATAYVSGGTVGLIPALVLLGVAMVALSALDLVLVSRRSDVRDFVVGARRFALLGIVATTFMIVAAAALFGAGITGFYIFRSSAHWVPSLAMLLLGLLCLLKSSLPLRFAKQLAAKTVAETMAQDGRRPVMLLRSFQDDDLELRMHRSIRHSPLEAASLEPYERFEELLAWQMWQFGPVLAIGQPGTVLQPLGAAREYHDDEHWQDAVRFHIRSSRIIVFVVGRSPGLLWEVAAVRAEGALPRCLFVFPPESADELQKRIVVLCAALELSTATFPIIDPQCPRLLAMYLTGDGLPVILTAGYRDDFAYSTAFERAGAQLGQPSIARHDVADIVRSEVIDVGHLLQAYDPDATRPERQRVVSRLFNFFLWFVR